MQILFVLSGSLLLLTTASLFRRADLSAHLEGSQMKEGAVLGAPALRAMFTEAFARIETGENGADID